MHWIDPDHLPEVSGTVDQFLVNTHGQADGFILTDGTEVHVPPHLSARLLAELRVGSSVQIRGVRPRRADMIAAVAIDTANARILDDGPDHHDDETALEEASHAAMTAEGIVRRSLHGPKGELRGALLEDGRIIRLPPHEAERFADLLIPGAALSVSGEGAATSFGTVVEAKEIGPSSSERHSVDPKKPKPRAPTDHGSKHRGKRPEPQPFEAEDGI